MENRNKHIASKIYKGMLCILILFQLILIVVEVLLHMSMFFCLNVLTLIYFIFRLYVFINVEREAKSKGMSIQDYMDSFKKKDL